MKNSSSLVIHAVIFICSVLTVFSYGYMLNNIDTPPSVIMSCLLISSPLLGTVAFIVFISKFFHSQKWLLIVISLFALPSILTSLWFVIWILGCADYVLDCLWHIMGYP